MAQQHGRISKRIVIVGGGFAGLAVATVLAQEQLPVTLLESAKLGFAASTRNQGWLYSGALFAPRDRALARMCFKSMRQTVRFCPECLEPGPTGMHFLISEPDTDAGLWTSAWTAARIPFSLEPMGRVLERLGGVDPDSIRSAFLVPDCGFRPDILLQKLADAALAAGVEIQTDARVAALTRDGDSVTGVTTTSGDEYGASLVILATGAQGAELWGGAACGGVGGQSMYTRVALQAHLVSMTPHLCDGPFCVVDCDGFNHISHRQDTRMTSVFGMDRWSVVSPNETNPPDESEFQRIEEHVRRFLPSGAGFTVDVKRWRGITLQAMHADQIDPGYVPLPTIIDHSMENPTVKNLLSVYPGRATLWGNLAEQTRRYVLEHFDQPASNVARPPWAADGQ